MNAMFRKALSLFLVCLFLLQIGLSAFAVTSAEGTDPAGVDPDSAVTEEAAAPAEATSDLAAANEEEGSAEAGVTSSLEVPPLLLPPSDVQGHWAEESLARAYYYGVLKGYDDGLIHPNDPITEAQILTILCRVLDAQATEAVSVSTDNWYYDAAAKAAAMGIYDGISSLSAGTLSREASFALLAKGFGLSYAYPDLGRLNAYSDAGSVSPEYQAGVASLINLGYISGYNGNIDPQGSITRAEFVTIMFRMVTLDRYVQDFSQAFPAGVLWTGTVTLRDRTYVKPLIFDCATTEITLNNVTADTVVILAQDLKKLNITGSTTISRLVFAGNYSGTLTINPTGKVAIDTVVIAAKDGNYSIKGNVNHVEISGSRGLVPRSTQSDYLPKVTIGTALSSLFISGENATVTVGKQKIETVRLTPTSRGNTLTLSADVTTMAINGLGNTVKTSAHVNTLAINKHNTIEGKGTAGTVTVYSKHSVIDLSKVDTTLDAIDYGIENITVELRAVDSLPVGQKLTVQAVITNPTYRVCQATWVINGTEQPPIEVAVHENGAIITHEKTFEYSQDMAKTYDVGLVVKYTTNDGENQWELDTKTINIENYSKEYYDQYLPANVLKRVTTGYAGNYTLTWALNNDYDALTKEVWINAKGYSSPTNYIVWINTTYQRVNIFQGSQGNWTLTKSFLAGTGRNGHNTPVGVYKVTARESAGWTHSTYHVSPVVRYVGNGYNAMAFHSRKWNSPKKNYLVDASIGFPVSLGCIRMYDEDVWWIYNYIPRDTPVVVF